MTLRVVVFLYSYLHFLILLLLLCIFFVPQRTSEGINFAEYFSMFFCKGDEIFFDAVSFSAVRFLEMQYCQTD